MVHTFIGSHPSRGNVDNQDNTHSNTSDDDERTPTGYATQPKEQFHIPSEARRRHPRHNTTQPVERPVKYARTSELEERTRVLEIAMRKILSRLNPDDPLIPLLNRGEQPAAVVATRNSPALSNALDLDSAPLNLSITAEPYQEGFKIPHLETYDVFGDPDEHLHTYQAIMRIQNATDAMMCKVFLATLKSMARRWYHKLPRHSIASYSELATLFSNKFLSKREIKHTATELMQVHQKEGKSLRDYMQRFNKSTLDIDNVPDTICLSALLHGLKPGRFLDDLLENPLSRGMKIPPPSGTINMISSGMHSGGQSARGRKAYARQVMTLNPSSLQKYEGCIYGFDNQPVSVEGVITLPIYVGSEPRFRMALVNFLVVKMESAFNAILGRTTLCELKVVISQPHLCMKFLTP
ncbi:hypothetical protein SLEP1_g49097 [Rubroshorea leprosula]|uniref:Retrotransposon gag domain-containing protein n=1 Tax=Rubroshorea leprosula TaxID=152421 RepID=A0AAV5LY58_9ROSI|nr:hypothetical protein SLEP1_g49097 [Rubroshorea leprosula]